MYKDIRVNAFKGLNSNVAPELIADGEARDIYNLRMEKVGKLVSRNGYIFGLFAGDPIPDETRYYEGIASYMRCLGIIGIGEMVLEEKWITMDTDRFMVYVIRMGDYDDSTINPEVDNTPPTLQLQEYYEHYLFVPITGVYKNHIVTSTVHTSDHLLKTNREEYPQNDSASNVSIYAPNRTLPGEGTTGAIDDHWIKHYIDMTQYRHRLMISDRINGDMVLADKKVEDTDNNHGFELRPNCLDVFEIDNVLLDDRTSASEAGADDKENASDDGVENGMGLYDFVLPEEKTVGTIDNFDNKLSNPEWVGDQSGKDKYDDISSEEFMIKYTLYMSYRDKTSLFIAGNFWHDDIPIKHPDAATVEDVNCVQILNDDEEYIFTNEQYGQQYNDILGKLELKEDEYYNSDGEYITEKAADVYVWEDHKISYYPSSGAEARTTNKYLKGIDRFFDKLAPGIPRITELNAKTGRNNHVPLSVWRYRFLWEYEDGTMSAPSPVLCCPDMMWSAVKDDEIDLDETATYAGRPAYMYDVEDYDTGTPYSYNMNCDMYHDTTTGYPDRQPTAGRLYVYDSGAGDMVPTDFGLLLYGIKEKLYGGLNHKYGIGTSASMAAITDEIERGNVGVYATAFISKGNIVLNGFAGEILDIPNYGQTAGFTEFLKDCVQDEHCFKSQTRPGRHPDYYPGVSLGKTVRYMPIQIAVPVFQKDDNPRTYNSLFDDEGRLRTAYINDTGMTTLYGTKRALVLPGFLDPILVELNSTPSVEWSKIYNWVPDGEYGYIYVNINPILNDLNNRDVAYLNNSRTNTAFRGVKNDEDRLTRVNADIDVDALSRLIKTGMCEIIVSKSGDRYDLYQHNIDAIPYPEPEIDPDGNSEPCYMGTQFDTGVLARLRDRYNSALSVSSGEAIYEDCRVLGRIVKGATMGDAAVYHENSVNQLENIEIRVYGEGERLTAHEQLTAYFPSSLLFKAPRMGIKIANANVPSRAKRLHIFRTKASHGNNYNPDDYGKVATIDIDRSTGSDTFGSVGDAYSEAPGEKITLSGGSETLNYYAGIYFFDDVKDSQLDFSMNINDYEGIIHPLKSRFNIAINERVYYANFEETWQAQAPRGNVLTVIEDVNFEIATVEDDDDPSDGYTSTDLEGVNTSLWVSYKIIYKDTEGTYTESKIIPADPGVYSIEITPGTDTKQVVLYFLPSEYAGYIEELQIYRAIEKATEPTAEMSSYYYIGSLEHGDEGIFIDHNQPGGRRLTDKDEDPTTNVYESGLRWSEPFRPDWIKLESFSEYRSGDGMQITGLESLYGNIVIFKETSMHRVAVQGAEVPISRTDEITPEIGCIAPMACINVNNTIFFLSWKGIMYYDNNELVPIDKKFNEEVLAAINEFTEEEIRDASCGYNPFYNEIYVNIPKLYTQGVSNSEIQEVGHVDMYPHITHQDAADDNTDYFLRKLYGNIYVVSLDKGYATKFMQQASLLNTSTYYYRKITTPGQMIRMYYTNSLGEMRSADILPILYSSRNESTEIMISKYWAGIYIETPYNINTAVRYANLSTLRRDASMQGQMLYTDTDDILDAGRIPDITALTGLSDFPPIIEAPVKIGYYSKFFTGDVETMIKRVRRVILNLFTRGLVTVKCVVIPKTHDLDTVNGVDYYYTGDDRIENLVLDSTAQLAIQTFSFNPTIRSYNPLPSSTTYLGTSMDGIGTNIIEIVPKNFEETIKNDKLNDWYGKPIRIAIDVETSMRTQINSLVLYVRPIHTYTS